MAADHALVAVPVPAGEHEVRLRYVVPGRGPGAALTLVSVLGLLAMGFGAQAVRAIRRRPTAAGSG